MTSNRPTEPATATDPDLIREVSPASTAQIPDARTQTPPASPAPSPHPAFQAALEILRRESPAPSGTPPPGPQISPSLPQIPDPRSQRLPSLPPPPDPIPARMLNEFVYCPRLFYYEHVEGVFVESADTIRGAVIHRRVDSGKGDLPPAAAPAAAGESDQTATAPATAAPAEVIHSRSVTLGSERLGVIAKLDLVEAHGAPAATPQGDLFTAREVIPVDYKAGAPREGSEANQLWPTDQMQLGLQILLLRDNGYACREGVIYYRATKQRVRFELTAEREAWVRSQIAEARRIMIGPIPPPLVASPKCRRCSLAPVCLPDETRLLASPSEGAALPASETSHTPEPPRRLIAARDDQRALYLNTPGLRVGRKDETLTVKLEDSLIEEVRLADVSHVALFGNIQLTTQAIQGLCDAEIPVTYFSGGGWFYGLTHGHGLKNVFLRIEQFRLARDPAFALRVARALVNGKIRNHRTLLMRNHVDAPSGTVNRLREAAQDALAAMSLDQLLGIEGAAAAAYFEQFGGMLKQEDPLDDEIPGAEAPRDPKEPRQLAFEFAGRHRRPPTDPVNALLSLAYSMLSKDCTIAAAAVGFDPYIGFFHQPRFGRPALALDLMEEFRPLVAESAVLTAINNRMVTPDDFVQAGKAVNLSPAGRKKFFLAYEQRMTGLLTHPLFDYKVSYRRALELQARILAKTLT
ncbi:MAG: CRISPR-associated endonuclease Cas1, partial [Verrucomicrobia bacterium]|nr:CRISPR-associated endonuclease Cas1 [Verrucomicrobiota bacterium]